MLIVGFMFNICDMCIVMKFTTMSWVKDQLMPRRITAGLVYNWLGSPRYLLMGVATFCVAFKTNCYDHTHFQIKI
jgi:hypothetical protein